MAEIVLNVELRETIGSGGSRAARREGKVPGVLYGGPRGPVPIAMNANAFGKALYTGKLLGHLVTLRYGEESQPVIAKDIQFHPSPTVRSTSTFIASMSISWSRSTCRSTSAITRPLPA